MRVCLLSVQAILLLSRGTAAWSILDSLPFFSSSWTGYGDRNSLEEVHEETHEKCECDSESKKRIVGGVESKRHEYPYVVNIIDTWTKRGGCGGTLISDNLVLTAAHCGWKVNPRSVTVVLGEHNVKERNSSREVLRVKKIVSHENYDDHNYYNDIAILVLEKDVTLQQGKISLACLPSKKISWNSQTLRVIGWGRTSDNGPTSDVLRKVDLKVVSLRNCRRYFGRIINTWNPKQICTYAKAKDSCQSDQARGSATTGSPCLPESWIKVGCLRTRPVGWLITIKKARDNNLVEGRNYEMDQRDRRGSEGQKRIRGTEEDQRDRRGSGTFPIFKLQHSSLFGTPFRALGSRVIQGVLSCSETQIMHIYKGVLSLLEVRVPVPSQE